MGLSKRQLRRMLASLAGAWWLAVSVVVAAGQAQPTAADPALEVRVNALAAELRCLVCQNQSLADSRADLAVDLKNQVREQLKAGRTSQQVIDYMTERYGDFVLYRPPLNTTTVLLWSGPLLLLLFGGLLLWRAICARRAEPEALPFDPEAEHRLEQLLQQYDTDNRPNGRVASGVIATESLPASSVKRG
jgi:cytochrome c-type biogenesis protein CcmH/NrfF